MRAGKRLFDLFWSLLGLAVLSPVMLLIAAVIRLDSGAPVFFRQERIGYRGRRFRMWKFRTMVANGGAGRSITVGNDPRITRAGWWLRRSKLDELPQLINVLRGEMTFVGPRPEVPEYVALYDDEQRHVLDLVPGITDPASNKYRDESRLLGEAEDPEALYVQEIMPDKIRLNLAYARRATVWSDAAEILRTVNPFVRRGGRRGGSE